jgi:hypothetical protein
VLHTEPAPGADFGVLERKAGVNTNILGNIRRPGRNVEGLAFPVNSETDVLMSFYGEA